MAAPESKDLNKSLTEEEGEEEVEMVVEEDEAALLKARQVLTGRNVTLNTLMEDGTIAAGRKVLSIDYLGQRFEADLLDNGKIKWDGSEEEFGTPSAWAHHCKRLVNPIKRSGCGWASVKYNNKKLDLWKSIWARKHRGVNSPYKTDSSPVKARKPNPLNAASHSGGTTPEKRPGHTDTSQTSPASQNLSKEDEEKTTHEEKMTQDPSGRDPHTQGLSSLQKMLAFDAPLPLTHPTHTSAHGNHGTHLEDAPHHHTSPPHSASYRDTHKDTHKDTHQDTHKDTHKDTFSQLVQHLHLSRRSVPYHALGVRSLDIDRHTLVQCEQFDSHSKLQPFSVSVASNALMLMDFHCNLIKSEVLGYLGGSWDSGTQHLHIEQVFPVTCRAGDTEQGPLVEGGIRRGMKARHMAVVGWYHSHVYCQADPSLHDVDAQMGHQLKMRGSGSMYQPCLAFIISPWQQGASMESQIQAFWVMPNLEHPAAYNIPMAVSYTVRRDTSLTEDVLTDMKNLSENYSGAHDRLCIREEWREGVTYCDKMRATIKAKLPEDQLDSESFLDYMTQMVGEMK